MSTASVNRGHYDALIRDHQKLMVMTDLLNEIAAQDRRNFPPHGGSIAALAARACRDYDPTTQPFDEPFRHVDRPNDEFRRGFLEGTRIAAEETNGVNPLLLQGMSDRYVSIYCTARRDASDLIKTIPYMHCEYCDAGKRTGLASNACENCLNTGLKYPEFAK
jgi:hypothetical protein